MVCCQVLGLVSTIDYSLQPWNPRSFCVPTPRFVSGMERNYLPACYRQAFGKTKCQNRSPNGTEYSAPLREI